MHACKQRLTRRAVHAARSVWDMRSNTLVRTLETGAEVTSIEVAADGSTITTADGKEVRLALRLL
jgi:hypothetical protein